LPVQKFKNSNKNLMLKKKASNLFSLHNRKFTTFFYTKLKFTFNLRNLEHFNSIYNSTYKKKDPFLSNDRKENKFLEKKETDLKEEESDNITGFDIFYEEVETNRLREESAQKVVEVLNNNNQSNFSSSLPCDQSNLSALEKKIKFLELQLRFFERLTKKLESDNSIVCEQRDALVNQLVEIEALHNSTLISVGRITLFMIHFS